MSKFQPGDRFVRTGGDRIWNDSNYDYKSGVIAGGTRDESQGSGGCECDPKTCCVREVRFDDYDYRLKEWPTNCHTISECLIDHEVTEQDIENAVASIKSAMH